MNTRCAPSPWLGRWEGNWEIGEYSGRFALVVSTVNDGSVIGEAWWYDTAALMPNEPLINARFDADALLAEQPCGLRLRMVLSDDATLTGTWRFNRYKGSMNAMHCSI